MNYLLKLNGKNYQIERKQDGYYLENKLIIKDLSEINYSLDFEHAALDDEHHFKIENIYYQASIEKENENSNLGKVGTGIIVSPMNGIVYSVDVHLNDRVKKGDKLMMIEAMKMLYSIYADKDGVITFCQDAKGTTIKSKQIVFKIE